MWKINFFKFQIYVYWMFLDHIYHRRYFSKCPGTFHEIFLKIDFFDHIYPFLTFFHPRWSTYPTKQHFWVTRVNQSAFFKIFRQNSTNLYLRFFHSPNRSQYIWVWKNCPQGDITQKYGTPHCVWPLGVFKMRRAELKNNFFQMAQKIFNFFSKVVRNDVPDPLTKFGEDRQGGKGPFPPCSRRNVKFRISYLTCVGCSGISDALG